MALKFDMSSGDWRDMYNAQMAQSGGETSGYKASIAGENLGLGISALGGYLQKHKGTIGKAYQRYLASFKGKPVVGADGKTTMTSPESFESFARGERDTKQRESSYKKYSKRNQIDEIRKIMMDLPGADYSEEINQQPSIEQVKDYIHNKLPYRIKDVKDLRKQHRKETYLDPAGAMIGGAGKAIGGAYSALDKSLLSGILPGGHDPKSQLSAEGEKAYQEYLGMMKNASPDEISDRAGWLESRATQFTDPKKQKEFRDKHGFKFKATGVPAALGGALGGVLKGGLKGGQSLLGGLKKGLGGLKEGLGDVYSDFDAIFAGGRLPGGYQGKEGDIYKAYQKYHAEQETAGNKPKDFDEWSQTYKEPLTGLPAIPGVIGKDISEFGKNISKFATGGKEAKDAWTKYDDLNKRWEAEQSNPSLSPPELIKLARELSEAKSAYQDVKGGFFGTPGSRKGVLEKVPGQIQNILTGSKTAIQEEDKQRIANMNKFFFPQTGGLGEYLKSKFSKGRKGTSNLPYTQTLTGNTMGQNPRQVPVPGGATHLWGRNPNQHVGLGVPDDIISNYTPIDEEEQYNILYNPNLSMRR